MDCTGKQVNYIDLKFEDNGDPYLINTLLGLQNYDSEIYIEEVMGQHRSQILPYTSHLQASNPQFSMRIIQEVSQYLCLRTTSIPKIVEHIQNYYPLNDDKMGSLLKLLRTHKLKLKRIHAKSKPNTFKQKIKLQPISLPAAQIKLQENEFSPFVFDQESQETRKKKRNRISAQNSRDRKKQYVRQIENQNKELKRKISLLTKPISIQKHSKEFIKMVLCLGINCYTNSLHGQQHSPITTVLEELTHEQKQDLGASYFCYPNLSSQISLLNLQHQQAICDLLSLMGEHSLLPHSFVQSVSSCSQSEAMEKNN